MDNEILKSVEVVPPAGRETVAERLARVALTIKDPSILKALYGEATKGKHLSTKIVVLADGVTREMSLEEIFVWHQAGLENPAPPAPDDSWENESAALEQLSARDAFLEAAAREFAAPDTAVERRREIWNEVGASGWLDIPVRVAAETTTTLRGLAAQVAAPAEPETPAPAPAAAPAAPARRQLRRQLRRPPASLDSPTEQWAPTNSPVPLGNP